MLEYTVTNFLQYTAKVVDTKYFITLFFMYTQSPNNAVSTSAVFTYADFGLFKNYEQVVETK